jgi:hypothetical protein
VETGADEEDRSGGGGGDRGADGSDPLVAPAFGQADDE